jgi:hypothetical protein
VRIGGQVSETREPEADLRRLIERSRIAEVINSLFVGTDLRDWKRVRGCFAEQVTFDMTSLVGGEPTRRSPQEITAGWEAGLKPIESVHHQVGNLSVDVRGAEATASCYGIAYHHRRTKSGRNTRLFVGSYDFHLRLDSGGWRVDMFRFNVKFVDGNLELEKEPPA